MEELLGKVIEHSGETVTAEMRLSKWFGTCRLRIRYGGERLDPTRCEKNDMEELSDQILVRTGFLPAWRWVGGRNELRLSLPVNALRTEFILLGCVLAAVALSLLGNSIPEAVKTGLSDYVLRFLSQGFLNLLNTFIGVMIFLVTVTGISGIGSVTTFGRIGKIMISRFLWTSFFVGGLVVLFIRLTFNIGTGGSWGEGNQIMAIIEVIFSIIPTNPIRPFLDGNNLQIVFMGVLVGIGLLLIGESGNLRAVLDQAQSMVMKCITIICILMPIYVFSSLLMQLWSNGLGVFVRLWKPLVLCAALAVVFMAGYFVAACLKFKVKPSVLLSKLLPDYLIGISTASATAAFNTTLEINEKKLGMDRSYVRVATPIGGMMNAGAASMFLMFNAAFTAEAYGLQANVAWWITFWIFGVLLTMAIPPVAGGAISCIMILMAQMQIPQEALPIAVTLSLFLDFIVSSTRIFCLHIEMLFQADILGLLDRETLQRKC